MCQNEISVDWNFLTAMTTIFIALVALAVAISSNLNQIKSIIINQLFEKAKEANSYTTDLSLNIVDDTKLFANEKYTLDNIGGILHAIDTAEWSLKQWQKDSIWFGLMNKQSLIDMFYLQLNGIVLENITPGHNFDRYLTNYFNKHPEYKKAERLKEEFNRIQSFLGKSRERYKRDD